MGFEPPDYLSSLARGNFSPLLSAKTVARKAERPVQNKMAMSVWWVIVNPEQSLLAP